MGGHFVGLVAAAPAVAKEVERITDPDVVGVGFRAAEPMVEELKSFFARDLSLNRRGIQQGMICRLSVAILGTKALKFYQEDLDVLFQVFNNVPAGLSHAQRRL